MSNFSKFKNNSYCVGGRHYSGIIKIHRVIASKGTKLLKGNCTICKRNKSMTLIEVMQQQKQKD